MKVKNRKGMVLTELLTIIAFVAVVVAILSFMAFQNLNRRKYTVFVQNARDFATQVSAYREEYTKYYKEIYLEDIVNDNYIKAFKNPFSGGGTCDLYESKVVTISSNERYVTLKCGDYLIYNQNVTDSNYKVYKVSEWQENIVNSLEMETVKLYNYEKNGEVILGNYVVMKEFISLYNKNENKNIENIDEINLNEVSVITKTFYRTKKLIIDNL